MKFVFEFGKRRNFIVCSKSAASLVEHLILPVAPVCNWVLSAAKEGSLLSDIPTPWVGLH
jgi:hypothetical protein